jgi:hypothetical protein
VCVTLGQVSNRADVTNRAVSRRRPTSFCQKDSPSGTPARPPLFGPLAFACGVGVRVLRSPLDGRRLGRAKALIR